MTTPYTRKAVGVPFTAYNAANTPALPAFTPGDLLILASAVHEGSYPTPTVTGWTMLGASTPGQVAIYGRIAQAGDVSPSINWGGSYATAVVNNYGGAPPALAGIVHMLNSRSNTSTNTLPYGSLGITVDNCLVLAYGLRNKTSTTDAATFSTMAPFAISNTDIRAGGSYAAVLNDYLQTSAATIASGAQTFQLSDGTQDSSQPYQTVIIALLAGTASGGGGGGSATPSRLSMMGVG